MRKSYLIKCVHVVDHSIAHDEKYKKQKRDVRSIQLYKQSTPYVTHDKLFSFKYD